MALRRIDGVNDAGEEEVKLVDATGKVRYVIARGDDESDEAFEARVAECLAMGV